MLTHKNQRGVAGISLGMAILVAGLATMMFGSLAIGLAATATGLGTVALFTLAQAD
jgi:hypothetical protein